jgi:hypothetical protein
MARCPLKNANGSVVDGLNRPVGTVCVEGWMRTCAMVRQLLGVDQRDHVCFSGNKQTLVHGTAVAVARNANRSVLDPMPGGVYA